MTLILGIPPIKAADWQNTTCNGNTFDLSSELTDQDQTEVKFGICSAIKNQSLSISFLY